jgi:hypothetical protein
VGVLYNIFIDPLAQTAGAPDFLVQMVWGGL